MSSLKIQTRHGMTRGGSTFGPLSGRAKVERCPTWRSKTALYKNLFMVDRLVEMRGGKGGRRALTLWQGYEEHGDWEPVEHLPGSPVKALDKRRDKEPAATDLAIWHTRPRRAPHARRDPARPSWPGCIP